MRTTRVGVLVGGLFVGLLAGCSSDELPPPPEGSKPLPECPSIDTTPCNTLESTCQQKLLALAACTYGVKSEPNVPIRVVTDEELVSELGSDGSAVEQAMDPRIVHFERAMVELSLMQPGDLTDTSGGADTYVDRIDGYYLDSKSGITLVDRGMRRDNAEANATLLHELIHAVQDAEYDLTTWATSQPPDYDTELAATSVPEGEATFYQYRAAAAMLGNDVSTFDWEEPLADVREQILEYGLKDASPYFGARTSFPYAHGALLAYRAWLTDGPLYHRAQFGNPPQRTRDVIRDSYQQPALSDPAPQLVEPPLPSPYISVDHGVLGAFMVQLFAHRASRGESGAMFADAWRADSLWVCRNGDETGYLWELAFDTAAHGRQFAELRGLPSAATVERRGERVFIAGSGTAPDFLLEAGRTFLKAAQME